MKLEQIIKQNLGKIVSIVSIVLALLSILVFIHPDILKIEMPTLLKRLKPSPYLLVVITVYITYLMLDNILLKQKISILFFCLVFTFLMTDLHFTNVDLGEYFKGKMNLFWQQELHSKILERSPDVIPHSYRFLADSFTGLLEFWTGNFISAKDLYRFSFQYLLLFSIFYWARLYSSIPIAILTTALYIVIYPVTIRFYAGQLIDPISHLTFVLSFIFFEKKQFFYFSLSVLIGLLAKESIAIMPVFYFLFADKFNRNHLLKSVLLLFLSGVVLVSIRLWVTQNSFGYQNVSGVTTTHILTNWNDSLRWHRQFLYSFVIFVPFIIIGWRQANQTIQKLLLFLAPTIFLSSLLFSWLCEARNYVPFILPACWITANYFFSLKEDETLT